jgi:preprotein translocase subunit SecG
MQTVVIVIHLMVVTAMIGVVLLQRSEGGGLGMGGGGGGGFLTSRGTANVLTRTTAILALIFFATSLVLSVLAGFDRKPRSILQGPAPASEPANGGAPAPLGDGRGVLDQLRQMGQPPASSGPAPSGPEPSSQPAEPQVPQSK